MESRKEKAVRLFKEGYNCSQSVFAAFCDRYGMDWETALKISSSFGGGMGRMREICGTVSAMMLIVGLETGAVYGKDREGKQYNYDMVQRTAKEFKKRNGSIICRELLGLEKKKEGFQETKPEERTEEYYKKRPCVQLVEEAADILEQFFQKQAEQTKQNQLLKFIPVKDQDQITYLAELAEKIWHEYFVDIISEEQIDYMVEKFQSAVAVKEQIDQKGYQYYYIQRDKEPVGYFGFCPDKAEKKLFLSKIYIKKEERRKGYASRVFEYLNTWCKENDYRSIWLTVNRYNNSAIGIYMKKGFEIIRTQVADIGNGFVMDDFIMEKKIKKS